MSTVGKLRALEGPTPRLTPLQLWASCPLIPGKHDWPSPAVGPKANRGTCKEAGTQVTLMLGLRPHTMLRAVSPMAPLSSLQPPGPPSASHMSLHWALCTQNTSYCHTPVTPSFLLSLLSQELATHSVSLHLTLSGHPEVPIHSCKLAASLSRNCEPGTRWINAGAGESGSQQTGVL